MTDTPNQLSSWPSAALSDYRESRCPRALTSIWCQMHLQGSANDKEAYSQPDAARRVEALKGGRHSRQLFWHDAEPAVVKVGAAMAVSNEDAADCYRRFANLGVAALFAHPLI